MLQPYRFQPEIAAWEAWPSARVTSPAKLTLLTYNLWFDQFRWRDRLTSALAEVDEHRADIIGLEEVTPEFLELILATDWVRSDYWVSDVSGETLQPNGVLLLARHPLQRLALCQLPSEKHRKFVIAEIGTPAGWLYVGALHLESSSSGTPMRLEQLDSILPGLHRAADAVLMGDFNFDPQDEAEQSRIEREYMDLWPTLRPTEPGYTVDSLHNHMRYVNKQQHRSARFDRILLRSDDHSWKPLAIGMIGTQPIAPDQPDVFPSDHFGLVGRILCSDAGSDPAAA